MAVTNLERPSTRRAGLARGLVEARWVLLGLALLLLALALAGAVEPLAAAVIFAATAALSAFTPAARAGEVAIPVYSGASRRH